MQITIDMLSHETTTDDHGSAPPQTLAELAARLRGTQLPPDYVAGKTRLRNEAMAQLEGSALAAERAVDRLLARGLVRFDDVAGRWEIGTQLQR